VNGFDSTSIAFQLGDRVGAPARNPGDVGLPQDIRRLLQQDVNVTPSIRGFGVLPIVVMPAELQALGGDDLSNSIELASKRGPFGFAAVALARRRRRRVNRLNAQVSTQLDRSDRIGAQPVETDMR
jgi:hypothetical protein